MMPAVLSPSAASDVTPSGRWLTPLRNWPAAALRSLQTNGCVIRIVIASVRGSAPREVGTCMLVDHAGIVGTIGGGQLEWSAIATARGMLSETGITPIQVQKLFLGPQLAQCCGGVVQVWFERYTTAAMPLLGALEEATQRGPVALMSKLAGTKIEHQVIRHPAFNEHSRRLIRNGATAELIYDGESITFVERVDADLPQVWLYGAGHVGQAVARVLTTLPLRLSWIDSRAEIMPAGVPSDVRVRISSDPVATVSEAPRGACFLVMSHSHVLDYELCKAILQRSDSPWVGLIGSKSKSARFRSRLLKDGVPPHRVDALVSPIGIGGIDSKHPSVIAISVAAQLMQVFSAETNTAPAEAQPCTPGGCHSCHIEPRRNQ